VTASAHEPPLIAHIIFRLAVGGMENGLLNLINRMPPERYRHAVICLTAHSEFRDRLRRHDVPVYCLEKREGKDFAAYFRLWRLLRQLRPDLVHSRTFGALDTQFYAALAGVRHRVHGEHGRYIDNLDGKNRKQYLMQRMISPLISHYTTVSDDIAGYLIREVGISASRVTRIHNGVDVDRFHPRVPASAAPWPTDFAPPGTFVFGTVGRAYPVKDPLNLVDAFLKLRQLAPQAAAGMRLAMAGGGPLLEDAKARLAAGGAASQAWISDDIDPIPEFLRGLDLFVLPSLGEGISNAILEAMATGLPVVATNVGGNSELVIDGSTGALVRSSDPEALAAAILEYARNPERRAAHGREARERALTHFSMEAMLDGYLRVYDKVLGTRTSAASGR